MNDFHWGCTSSAARVDESRFSCHYRGQWLLGLATSGHGVVARSIQYLLDSNTGWTCRRSVGTIRDMAREFHIEKLSDEFGQSTLVLKCAACGHERNAEPHALGRLCGWDARLKMSQRECDALNAVKRTAS
jgi:hypothetical protein